MRDLVAIKILVAYTNFPVALQTNLVSYPVMTNQALDRAIEKAGGQLPLARAIGSKQQTISFWKTKASARVPAEMCIAIEAATGVKREELRPDIFAVPPGARAHAATYD